jgi:hypothetical protein
LAELGYLSTAVPKRGEIITIRSEGLWIVTSQEGGPESKPEGVNQSEVGSGDVPIQSLGV